MHLHLSYLILHDQQSYQGRTIRVSNTCYSCATVLGIHRRLYAFVPQSFWRSYRLSSDYYSPRTSICKISGPHYTRRYAEKLCQNKLTTVLSCFSAQDSRVRYYSTESLYNIAKVAKGEVLLYFNEIFDALCKVIAQLFCEADARALCRF